MTKLATSKPAKKVFGRKKEVHYGEYYAAQTVAKPPFKIFIFVLIVVFALVGAGFGVFFIASGEKASLQPPTEIEYTFDQEEDFWVYLNWDKSTLARYYKIDYIYELYPSEMKSVMVTDDSYRIERKRGLLQFRVSAVDKAGRESPSAWFELTINPLQLQSPRRVSSTLQTEGLNISWDEVTYKYFHNHYPVQLYEYIEEFYYFEDGEYIMEDAHRNSKTLNTNRFTIEPDSLEKLRNDEYAKIIIRVRALNYTRTLTGNYQNLPEELYDIYDINSSWGYTEYSLL